MSKLLRYDQIRIRTNLCYEIRIHANFSQLHHNPKSLVTQN